VLVLSHLGAIAIAAIWVWILTAVGRAVIDRYAGPGEPDDETDLYRLVTDFAIGVGVAGTALLALGAVGILRSWSVLLGVAAVAVLLRGAMAATGRRAVTACREFVVDTREAGAVAWIWAPVAVVIVMAAIAALAPVTDWDSLMYHLTVPLRWLQEGRVYLPTDNLHATRTGLQQILYVVPLALGEHRAATLVSFAFALVLAATVHAVVRERFGARAAVFAGSTFWAAATVWFVAVTPRNDVALALYLLLAQDRIMRAAGEASRRSLVLAGALLGLAVATKFQAVPYALALLPLAYLDLRGGLDSGPSERRAPGAVIARMGIVACVSVLVAAPWLAKNVLLVGAPFYPLLATPVPQPWIASLAGGALPTLPEAMTQLIWQLTRPLNLSDYFLDPGRLSIEAEATSYWPNLLLLALPLIILARSERRALSALCVPALLYLGMVRIGFPHANLRYLLPAVVPLAAAAAVAVVRLFERVARGDRVLALLGVGVLVPVLMAAGRTTLRTHAHLHAVGLLSPGAYLAVHPEYDRLHRTMVEVADLAPDAKVLMLFDARGFYAPRAVLQDNKLTNWPWIEVIRERREDAEPCALGSGITHVLVNRGTLSFYLGSGALNTALLRVPELGAFLTRCTHTVSEGGGMSLYEIRGAGPGTGVAP
jgi:hypothetical protein